MSDPVSVSLSLAQLNAVIECMKMYQRQTVDLTNDGLITSLSAILLANENVNSPPPDLPSADAQSADGVT